MSRLATDYKVLSEVTLRDGRTRSTAVSKLDGATYDIYTATNTEEARIHRTLDGKEGIPRYYGVWSEPDGAARLQLEANLQGNLQEDLEARALKLARRQADGEKALYTEEEITNFLLDVCSGLQALHESGNAHCSLTTSNILLFKTPKRTVFKISNFSSCVTLDVHQHNYEILRNLPHLQTMSAGKRKVLENEAHSDHYHSSPTPLSLASPDIIRCVQRNATYCAHLAEGDMYALGLILLQMLNTLPVAHSTEGKEIAHGIVRPQLVQHVSPHLQAIVRKSLEFDPTLRPLPSVVLDVLRQSLKKNKAMKLQQAAGVTPRGQCRSATPRTARPAQTPVSGWTTQMGMVRSPSPPPSVSLRSSHRRHVACPEPRAPVVPSQGKYDKVSLKKFIKARHTQLMNMIHCTEYTQYTTH